ncbi:hypothetical protein SEA_RUBYRALPH_89 [Microbacterium phage RubyRalph]|nr:hypothetical protein SEA_RUBYRALPH_89 [Microbacterium phage RubyRalph]
MIENRSNMKTAAEIAMEIAASERFKDLTVDDLGLSVEEMMVAAIEADRAQRAVGENETIDPDPRFPNRPTHPDFARLSSAVIEQDAIADLLGLEQAAKFDLASATYLARGRVEMMGFAGAHENVIMRITTLYLDALNLGIGFAERGGHRPAETGTAGDKEGSL